MFPIVVLLGLNGLLVGILNAYDHFTIPALVAAGLERGDHRRARLPHAGCSRATTSSTPTRSACSSAPSSSSRWRSRCSGDSTSGSASTSDWRDPRVKRVLLLMLPVTIGLGLINFNLLINSIARLARVRGGAGAIDAAFRIYMLPQGMFSVAIATVLFPTLSRLAARHDLDGLRRTQRDRHAADLPAADPRRRVHARARRADHAADLRARRVHAASTDQVAEALFWFSFSLPFSGVEPAAHAHVLQPPAPVDADRARRRHPRRSTSSCRVALYEPFGIAGIVHRHRRLDRRDDARPGALPAAPDRRRLELGTTLTAVARMLVAAAVARRRRVRRLVGARRRARHASLRGADRVGRRRARARQRRLRRGRPRAARPRGARSSSTWRARDAAARS